MSEIAGIQQAVWLRAEGGCAVVLVEVDGEWVEIIREMLDSPFSHIKEPSADLVPAPPSQAQPDVTDEMVEAALAEFIEQDWPRDQSDENAECLRSDMRAALEAAIAVPRTSPSMATTHRESTVLFVGQALSAVRAALSAREGGGK